ncbi:unnamed protein product, partial [Symbiodinium necroappetens]
MHAKDVLRNKAKPSQNGATTQSARSAKELGLTMAAHGYQKAWQESLGLLVQASRTSIQLNIILLNSVISACQRAARWQAALSLAVHACEWSLQADIVSYNSAATACAACASEVPAVSWQLALATLMSAECSLLQPDARSFTAIMQGCIRLGDWPACLEFLRSMKSRNLDVDAFACGAAVSACDKAGQWKWALYLLQYGISAGTGKAGNWQVPVATAMTTCGRASKWECSLQLLQDMETSCTPNVVVFSAAISSAERGSLWQVALDIMIRMGASRILPNVIVYSTFLGGLERSGNWEMVFDMLADMFHAALAPTSVTFDVLLRTCRHALGWQYACHILYSMMPASKVTPTSKSINACLGVLEAELQWPLSIHMLNASAMCDIASYSIAASTCEKSSAWHAAVAVCARAESLRLKPDEVSLGVLISAWEKGRAWQMAISTLMMIVEQAVEPSEISFAAALRACQSCGSWEAALSLLRIVPNSVRSESGLLNPVLGACASSHEWERALSLFSAAGVACALQADVVTLTTVMSACEAGLKWQEAVAVLFEAVGESLLPDPDPTAFNVAISSCSKVQNWRAALAVLRSESHSERSSGRFPDVISYNAVLGSCKQTESWRQAIALLHDMSQRSLVPDLTTFHGVLEACACGQAWELSLQVLHQLTALRLPTGIATNLAASACQQATELNRAGVLLQSVLDAAFAGCSDPVTLKAALDVTEAGYSGIQVMPCLEELTRWARDQLASVVQQQLRQLMRQSSSDMQDSGQAVVASEILQWHGHVPEQFWAEFVHVVGKPAERQLRLLCNPELQRDGNQARLHAPTLERQFGLSPLFSQEVLHCLGMRDPESIETWLGYPRAIARRCSQHVSTAADPTSKHLAAWASWTFFHEFPIACRSRCHGHAVSDEAAQMLRPVQVQHDRRPHSERQLLEALAVTLRHRCFKRPCWIEAGDTSDLSLSNKVVFRGVPDNCSAEDISNLLQKYGPLECICYEKGAGSGIAEYLFCGSAERVEKESNRPDSPLQLAGNRVHVLRGAPRWPGSTDTGAFQQVLVTPTPKTESLDVVVFRGQSSASGIGLVAEMAKTKTTSLVIWDRHHRPREEPKVSTLQKKIYTEVFAEQEPDKDVMKRAGDFFSTGAPKCALVHLAEEKYKVEAAVERPLSQVNDLMDACRHNHLETIAGFNAFKVYKPWLHANRACTFVLIPPKLCHEWDDDIATCTVGSRRIVRADPVRLPDGSGWTMGLQMVHSSASVNAVLASTTIHDLVTADDATKNLLAGRCIELT